jgi:hypothetical protein
MWFLLSPETNLPFSSKRRCTSLGKASTFFANSEMAPQFSSRESALPGGGLMDFRRLVLLPPADVNSRRKSAPFPNDSLIDSESAFGRFALRFYGFTKHN